MFRSKKNTFSVAIPKSVLEAIFDECDGFSVDETGGRTLGTYRHEGNHYEVEVTGMLGPGPNAERTPTFFMQDGDYQEKQFRLIEAKHPEVEHLGNWHTHHVNGYPTLSGGDKTTYHKTVNHPKHNLDFFYALLVVKKNAGRSPRYDIKHFFFRRNDDTIYEIPHSEVRLTDAPMLTVGKEVVTPHGPRSQLDDGKSPNVERVKDQEFFAEFYPDLKPLFSKKIGAPYWKGTMPLVDGSHALVVAMESGENGAASYSITASDENPVLADVAESYKRRQFRSARQAVLNLEKDLNRAIYKSKRG